MMRTHNGLEFWIKRMSTFVVWLLIGMFVMFYPMLISIYVFLPLFIGLMGYIMIIGIERRKWSSVMIALLYFINLEANLSLPYFVTLIAVLIVYLMVHQNLNYFRRCIICVPLIIVTLTDLIYVGLMLGYDFLFQTESIILDTLLLYSLIVDMLVVVILA